MLHSCRVDKMESMYVSSHMESSRLWIICLVTSTPWLVLRQCSAISVVVLAADIWLADGSWQWDFVSSVFFVCLNFATSPSSHSNMQLESWQTMCHTRDSVLCWGLWQSNAWTAKYLVLRCISKGGTIPEQGNTSSLTAVSVNLYDQDFRFSSILVLLNNTLAHFQKIYPLSCCQYTIQYLSFPTFVIHASVPLVSPASFLVTCNKHPSNIPPFLKCQL